MESEWDKKIRRKPMDSERKIQHLIECTNLQSKGFFQVVVRFKDLKLLSSKILFIQSLINFKVFIFKYIYLSLIHLHLPLMYVLMISLSTFLKLRLPGLAQLGSNKQVIRGKSCVCAERTGLEGGKQVSFIGIFKSQWGKAQ